MNGDKGTMKILIRTQGTLAIYEQIVDQLKNAIVTGELKAGEALEKEGLVRAVPGKGFYVCEHNKDYLKEKQYVSLERRMAEILADCRKAGMGKEDVLDMVAALFEPV